MKKIFFIAVITFLFVGNDNFVNAHDKCQTVLDSFQSLSNCEKANFIKAYFGNDSARKQNGWCFTDIISEVEEITNIEASCLKGTAGYINYANDSSFLIDFVKWEQVLCSKGYTKPKGCLKRKLHRNHKTKEQN